MKTRGTSNTNARGNTAQRRRRRAWLVKAFETAPGHCACVFCGCDLTVETLTVDRIVPGCRGGTYVRENIRPACGRCNSVEGGSLRRAA